jgi:hypothetical protein
VDLPRQVYALMDNKELDQAPIEISIGDASDWNGRGYGIFWAVNAFKGPRRKSSCSRVYSWMGALKSLCGVL